MATYEQSGILTFKNDSGDLYRMYPVTKKENVSGMDDIDAHIIDTNNPHNVTAAQIGAASSTPVSATSTDGVTYTATVDGIDSLYVGANFIMIPNADSTSQSVTLNVNNLGAKNLRRKVSAGSSVTASGYTNDWLAANKPVRVMYDGVFWTVDIVQAHASDLMGSVPITKGGTGATDGSTGLANLLAAGNMVLSAYQYGDTLPEPGVAGRIFFKEDNSLQTILQAVYPVGAMYISTISTNPATLFGFGTWEQVKDTFLLAAGDTYSAGTTGGEAAHTLTVDEMPQHGHNVCVSGSYSDVNQVYWGSGVGSLDNNAWGFKYGTVPSGGTYVSAAYTGGNGSHNNMPPYLAVYVWQRTA